MRYNRNVLFTTNYGIFYEGWQLLDLPVEEQFWDSYLWCNYYVYTRKSTFYLLIKITDSNGKLLFEGEIPSIDKWKEVKKQIKKCTEKCTEQNVVYLVDEVGNYICDDNNIFIIE